MAMTKKEKAEFDAAIYRAELLGALRWTSEVKKDIAPPGPLISNDYVTGWDYNSNSMIAGKAWTSSYSHGNGEICGKHGSQYAKRLFSTKKLALMAMRNEIEKEAAKKLLLIDKMIKECDWEQNAK